MQQCLRNRRGLSYFDTHIDGCVRCGRPSLGNLVQLNSLRSVSVSLRCKMTRVPNMASSREKPLQHRMLTKSSIRSTVRKHDRGKRVPICDLGVANTQRASSDAGRHFSHGRNS